MPDALTGGTGQETVILSEGAKPRDRRLRFLLQMASKLRVGTLEIVLPDGSRHRAIATEAPRAEITIHHPSAVTRLATGGSLGLAEAYLDGLWSSPDIRAIMALASINEQEWEADLNGRRLKRLIAKFLHMLRPNTRSGSKRNIVDHYDLGNEFYSAWLDPTMSYSSAYFGGDLGVSLEKAQLEKVHHLCQMLQLPPRQPSHPADHIGCSPGVFR